MPAETALAHFVATALAERLPLCISLEGGLMFSDAVWEAWLLQLRDSPWLLPRATAWLARGRAATEQQLASRGAFKGGRLPLRADVCEALARFRAQGGQVCLLAESDSPVTSSVVQHLGLDDSQQLFGHARAQWAEELRRRFPNGYAALGVAHEESVYPNAKRLCIVGTRRMQDPTAEDNDAQRVLRLPGGRSLGGALLKELRPHQWAKNGLLLVPVFLAPGVPPLGRIGTALLAATTFSLCASAGYVLNDLLDLEADRGHRTKRYRPFASGDLPIAFGPPLLFALLAAGFGLAWMALPAPFLALLGLYFIGTLGYSLWLKKLQLIDVLVLAGLYAHRILAGGVATTTPVSTWLLGFSMFLFTSLAFAKRYVELDAMVADTRVKNRGYYKSDMRVVLAMGTSSGNIAALVLVLYADSKAVRINYHEPALLWLLLPVLLYWLGRLWLLTGRGELQDDPVKFALKDGPSLLCGVVALLLLFLARFPPSYLTAFLSTLT